MNTGELTLLKQDKILGEYNQDNYFSERIYADSRDGVKIPISIVYNKNYKKTFHKISCSMDMDHMDQP